MAQHAFDSHTGSRIPMKIALYGASGIIGSRIAREALRRDHAVTAITRGGTHVDAATWSVAGDLADAESVRTAAAGHDAIVSATGPSRSGAPHQEWLAAVENLVDASGDTRVLFVGGAGSLLTPDGTRLVDGDDFPPEYRAEALSGAAALDLFRAARADLDWTFFSPAPVIAPGARTGSYTLGLDSPAGLQISAEDYAVALVDELEHPRHRRQRFTAAN
jgi:uncharacterized protein